MKIPKKGDVVIIHFKFSEKESFKAMVVRVSDNSFNLSTGTWSKLITYRRIDNNITSYCDATWITKILEQIPGGAVAVVEGNQRIGI